MESSTPPKLYPVAFWSIVLIAPLPGLMVYLAWISELDQYGYIFPLLLALTALILFRWDYVPRMPTEPVSVGLVGLAVLATLFASYRASPWMSAIAFVLALTAWLRTHLSSTEDRHRLTYLSLLSLMVIRLPLNLDLRLAAALQRSTSQISSYLLDSFGVTHYLRGNVIELPGGTLFVEEACSGVQSLFTVLFLVCLWMVFRRRPLIATPSYLLAGVIWAMLMNVVRITAIALAQEKYQIDLSTGTPHEILGWICLLAAVLMMLSTDRLLRVFFYPVPPDESGHLGNPASRLWNWCLLLGVPEERNEFNDREIRERVASVAIHKSLATGMLATALLFCLPSFALGYRVVATRFESQQAAREKPLLWDPEATLMSATSYASLITNHRSLRDANNKQLGNHADVWTVVIGGNPVRIAISQPYPEWHDMRLCYSGNGWQVNEWKPVLPPTELARSQFTRSKRSNGSDPKTADELELAVNGWNISYAEMVRDTGEFGTLMFCGMTREMELLSPPMSGLYSLLDDRIKDRSSLQSNIIMLQLWTESRTPLIPEEFKKLQLLFDSFRLTVLRELSSSDESTQSISDANLTARDLPGVRR